jgi:hypothetical protein
MFNFGISPRIKSKKAKPIVNPFRLKPISKPRYVGQVKLGVGIPRPPYKRTQSERSLIRKNPWGDRDGDGVPNWIDCKPLNKNKQGPGWKKGSNRIRKKHPVEIYTENYIKKNKNKSFADMSDKEFDSFIHKMPGLPKPISSTDLKSFLKKELASKPWNKDGNKNMIPLPGGASYDITEPDRTSKEYSEWEAIGRRRRGFNAIEKDNKRNKLKKHKSILEGKWTGDYWYSKGDEEMDESETKIKYPDEIEEAELMPIGWFEEEEDED